MHCFVRSHNSPFIADKYLLSKTWFNKLHIQHLSNGTVAVSMYNKTINKFNFELKIEFIDLFVNFLGNLML